MLILFFISLLLFLLFLLFKIPPSPHHLLSYQLAINP
jgi:hypothetical protein